MTDPAELAQIGKRIQVFAILGLAVSQIYAWADFFAYNRNTGFPFDPAGIFHNHLYSVLRHPVCYTNSASQ